MSDDRSDDYVRPRPVREYARQESRTSRRVDEHLTRLEALLTRIDHRVRAFELEQSNAVTELATKVGFSEKEQALLRDAMDGIKAAQIEDAQHDRKMLLKALGTSIVGGGGMGLLAHFLGGG